MNNKSSLDKLIVGDKRYKSINTQAAMVIKDMTNIALDINAKEEKTDMCKAWEDMKIEMENKGKKEEQAKNLKENLRKAKALVKAGTAKEVVAKIMGVNIALL